MRKIFLLLFIGLYSYGDLSAAAHKNNFDDIWFKGGLEEAFKLANKTNKHVFLYWGAVWCPPCNELKGQVFSKKKFRELVKSTIPVYLDGDFESAQIWGERFQVSGYPTILLLTKDKIEVMRITASINIDEFEVAFKSGLASFKPFHLSLEKVLKGKGDRADWQRIAYSSSWPNTKDKEWGAGEKFQKMNLLQKNIPKEYEPERAILTASLISKAASINEKSSKEDKRVEKEISKKSKELVQILLKNKKSIFSVRSFIAYQTPEIMAWLKKNISKKDYENIRSSWVKASDYIANSKEASIDVRFWAKTSRYQIYLLENPKQKILPSKIQMGIKSITKWAVTEARKNYYDRHSVISGAAWLLSQIKDYKGGRKILLDELKETDTPWYYQSSLADLERRTGNKGKALYYSKLARLSSKGGATRLQWITADLSRSASLMPKSNKNKRVNEILNDLYKTSFSLKDGFTGRNKNILKRVEKIVAKLEKTKNLQTTFKTFSSKCIHLDKETKKKCEKHFQLLLK